MNDYMMIADSYRDMAKKGRIDEDIAEKNVRIYEFLATCGSDDICRMVDSAAFNDVIKAFVKTAVKDAGIDENIGGKILNQLRYIFDEKTAKEVLEESFENEETIEKEDKKRLKRDNEYGF